MLCYFTESDKVEDPDSYITDDNCKKYSFSQFRTEDDEYIDDVIATDDAPYYIQLHVRTKGKLGSGREIFFAPNRSYPLPDFVQNTKNNFALYQINQVSSRTNRIFGYSFVNLSHSINTLTFGAMYRPMYAL